MQPADHPGEITVLLQQVAHGDTRAADRLIPLVLDELRRSGKDPKPDRLGGDDGHFPFGTTTVAG